MYSGWENDWVDEFALAASKGADCGTAKAIAWAKVRSLAPRAPKVDNPERRRLYIHPNKSAIAAAKRGLAARKKAPKSKRGGLDAMQAKEQGIGSGVLRARDIVAGKRVNAYQVKAFFDRHQGNYLTALDKGLKPHESRAIQAWLLWGGDPLYRQVKREVERDRRKRNPAAAPAAPSSTGKKKSRRRLYTVPPLRKGKPSTWKETKTGRHRARLGSLPPKWRSEWVNIYKKQLKSVKRRSDLNENQAKTVAAMSAWSTIKRMGCRLPKGTKRARDRDRFEGWACPEWETTEKARKKIIEEVRKESEGVAKRERARERKRAAAAKKEQKKREKSERDFARSVKKIRKKVVEQQTAEEYSEAFKKKYGAYGLLPPEPKKKGKKKAVKKKTRKKPKEEQVSTGTKPYSQKRKYKAGDIVHHKKYGIGVVRSVTQKSMEVKFKKRTDGRQVRTLKMGG